MDDCTPTQVCSKCGIEYPATSKFFSKGHSPNGLYYYCKTCQRTYRKQHYADNKEDESKKRQIWRENNRSKHIAQSKRYVLRHPDKVKSQKRAYYLEHKDYRNARQREWEKENIDKVRLCGRIKAHKRRTNQVGKPFDFCKEDWERALEYFNGRCAVCGKEPGFWTIIAQDHWIPVNSPLFPGTTKTNIIPLCHAKRDGKDGCNNSKSDKLPEQWLIEKFGKRKARETLARINAYFEWVKRQ